MAIEISRRDWLKGVMASAGLAAVGVPLDVVEAAAPVLSNPSVRPRTIEFGDFWVRSGGSDFFIGKTSYLSARGEIVSWFDDDESWIKAFPTNMVDIDATVLMDQSGLAVVHNAMDSRDVLEAFFGHYAGSYRVASAFIRSASLEITPHDLVTLRVELSGRDGGVA